MSEPAAKYEVSDDDNIEPGTYGIEAFENPDKHEISIKINVSDTHSFVMTMWKTDAIELALLILGDEARAWYNRREMHKTEKEK